MPMFKARNAVPSFVVNGKDLLLGLESNTILSFTYTDNTSDKADDLCIELADPNRSWMLRYLPADAKKGNECSASINLKNWTQFGDNRVFECGTFWIQHVGIKGPPNVVSIKCSSIPPNGVKETKKHRSWENSKLKDISGQIASENGLTLFYDTEKNPTVKRAEQTDKPDIAFLREKCKEAELCLKIHKKQLVIYSEQEYEAREPVFTMVYENPPNRKIAHYLTYEFNAKTDDVYKEAENSYVNPETGKLTKSKFPDEKDPADSSYFQEGGLIAEGTYSKLSTNEGIASDPDEGGEGSPKDYADADDFLNDDPAKNKGKGKGNKAKGKGKAKAKLREKNKKEHQCHFCMFGNIELLSGLCCQTEGFGIFDKKWFIESSAHKIAGGGYVVDLKLRGALKGY